LKFRDRYDPDVRRHLRAQRGVPLRNCHGVGEAAGTLTTRSPVCLPPRQHK
jgi:hypothetical protein